MARQDSFHYFAHNADTRNDLRMKGVRKKFGLAGYALYNMLLEVLTAQKDLCIDIEETGELLAADFGVRMERLKNFIDYCVSIHLLALDGSLLYSESLRERFAETKAKAEELSAVRAEAGKRGAAKRWSSKETATTTEETANNSESMASDSETIASEGEAMAKNSSEIANDSNAMASDSYIKVKDKDKYNVVDDARTREAPPPSPSEPEGSAQGKGQAAGSPQSPPHPPEDREEQWHDNLATNRTFREQVALAVGLRPAEVIDWLKTFRAECAAKGTRHEDENDLRRHAFDWLRCHKAYNTQTDKPNGKPNPQAQSRHRVVERMASSDADYRVTAL